MQQPLVLLLKNAALWWGPGPVVVFLFVMLNWIIAWQKTQLDELRLRNLTSEDVVSSEQLHQVRYDHTFGENTRSVRQAIPDATACRLVVLTGMSQMFSINDRQPGDQTTSEEMDDLLRERGTRVFGLAAPNISNEEALFVLLTTLLEKKTKPAVFIFGACFDKFRNVDLRPGYQRWLNDDRVLRELWERTKNQASTPFPLAADKMMRTLVELDSKSGAADESELSIETRIREAAAAVVPAVASRKLLYSQALLQLYYLRNFVFSIKSSSKRPMIRSRYLMNQQFFELISETCQQNGVRFVSYVIPFNGLAEHPYVLSEYEQFKEWFEQVCRKRDVPHANLENLVPNEDWGFWMGGPDFKHFRGEGHRRVARELIRTFGETVLTPSAEQHR